MLYMNDSTIHPEDVTAVRDVLQAMADRYPCANDPDKPALVGTAADFGFHDTLIQNESTQTLSIERIDGGTWRVRFDSHRAHGASTTSGWVYCTDLALAIARMNERTS